jgi:hypothetical protein
MVAEGFDFRRDLGGTWRRFGFDGDQRGAEVFSLQTASGVFDQFAAEQPLGLIVTDVEVAGVASGAVSLAQFGPTTGRVEGADKVFGIDEGFHQQDGMTVTVLPVVTKAG